jgi:hypothetical protein
MSELDVIIDACLREMAAEGATIEDCLRRHPEQAAELRPLLEAARRLAGSGIEPSTSYKRFARARLLQTIGGNRSRSAGTSPVWRFAMGAVAFALVFLVSTTAVAQTALPGQLLYGWKLGSEEVWRAVSSDDVGEDLTLADRRTAELTSVPGDPDRQSRARDELHVVLKRLAADKDPMNGPKIERALEAHQKKLSDAGLHDKDLDDLVRENKGKGH